MVAVSPWEGVLPEWPLSGKFNHLERQLMWPPKASADALAQAEVTGEVLVGFKVSPTDGKLVSVYADFQPAFVVPDDATCAGFPREGGRFDVVRCRWHAASRRVEYAHSRFVAVLRVSGADLRGTVDSARHVAQLVFFEKDRVVLKVLARHDDVLFGIHDVDATGLAGLTIWDGSRLYREHWRDSLKWWTAPREVGFVLLKAYGDIRQWPSPSASERANEEWFAKIADE